jgi:hypothetical protein
MLHLILFLAFGAVCGGGNRWRSGSLTVARFRWWGDGVPQGYLLLGPSLWLQCRGRICRRHAVLFVIMLLNAGEERTKGMMHALGVPGMSWAAS